jgi:hypothetical protein
MVSKRPLLFTAFGTFFLLTGIITVLSILTGLHLNQPLGWQHWAYAVLDFSFAYGFFSMQAWLVPFVAAALGANVLLAGMQWYTQNAPPDSLTKSGFVLAIGALALVGLRMYKLRTDKSSKPTAIIFAATLLAVFGYTISTYLT